MPGKLIVDEIEDSGGTSVIGRKNYIINGNFDIWQRGTSLTGQTSSKYLADRWRTEPSTTTYDYNQGTFTVGQTDVPNNPQFYADFTITGADDNFRPEQRIEDVRTLAGETITISFWAKYTTNPPTDFRTTIRQYFGSGGSSDVYTVFASGQTLTTSWQKFEVTGTVPSISGKTIGTGNLLSISPFWNGNNETFDVQIAQVQVEKGSVATDFEVRPIGEEFALCQRYYLRWDYDEFNIVQTVGMGCYNNATQILAIVNHPVKMRANPTLSYSNLSHLDIEPFDVPPSSVSLAFSGYMNTNLDVYDTGSRTTGFIGHITVDTPTGYMDLDAEL